MTSVSKLISAAILVFAGLFAFHGSALAMTMQPGASCTPYGSSNIAGLSAEPGGARNISGNSMWVNCPVPRTGPVPSNGFVVWVDGNGGGGTMYCYLYSYNYNGSFLGLNSFSASGTFSAGMTLAPALVPYFSSQSVLCYLANNAVIYDLEVGN